MSDRDMQIGPGYDDYGRICTICYQRDEKHLPDCPRVKDVCSTGDHAACRMQRCQCDCHPPLSGVEMFEIRQLIRAAKKKQGTR